MSWNMQSRLAPFGKGTVLVFSALLLTWLFLRAGAVAPSAHYHYLANLRGLQQEDTALNAAVLASQADLLQNYDVMARHLDEIRRLTQAIAELPEFLAANHRAALRAKVQEIAALHQHKAELIDRFRRSNSVLRNSAAYFGPAVDEFLHQLPPGHPLYRDYDDYFRAVLAIKHSADRHRIAELRAQTERLTALHLPPPQRSALDHLLVHSRVIIELQPELNDVTRAILQLPTTGRQEEMIRLYTEAHSHAQETAAFFRLLLYAVALLLLAYAVWAYLRMARNRRELEQAHRELQERYAAQRAVEQRLRLFASLFFNAAEGMIITDAETRIMAVNPAFSTITGYAEHEILGQTPALLQSGRHDRDYYREMWFELDKTGHWQGEVWNRRKDGAIYPEWLSITAVRDATGQITHFIGIFTDLTERKKAEAHLLHLVQHDVLTGLPNRLLFDDRLTQSLLKAKHSGKTTAVLFLDVDRFKNINETLGHEIGDELLVQIAKRCQTVLRDTDTLARHGGDAFIAMLPELDQPLEATPAAHKLLQVLALPYRLAGHELSVTVSIGIAIGPADGETVSELVRNAEAAMYRAKKDGRNTFRYYSADMNVASLSELLLEADLHKALERGELLVYYQPKIATVTGALVGAEALLRWQHHEHGLISPSRFIPIAEESGLMPALGEWVMFAVCRQQRAWLDAGLPVVPVAVNISAVQFAQQDVPTILAAALADSHLPASLLELEVTESLLLHDIERTRIVLARLQNMGVRLAIDDFGTGYSSLSYLRHLPVHGLKIDRSFVKDTGSDDEASKLTAAIIALGHAIGLSVIAEGIETAAQRDYCAAHGCDQLQGFLIDQPLPADEFAHRLSLRSSL